jgi:histidinol-phosphate phosphatase family protein
LAGEWIGTEDVPTLIDGNQLWREILPQAIRGKPALFLDRDGVVVVETGYLCRREDVALLPGAAEVVAAANRSGIAVVIVTNQAGIGRGKFGWAEFASVQEAIAAALAAQGARWDAVYACPHHPSAKGIFGHPDHPARKPNPGMIHTPIGTTVPPRPMRAQEQGLVAIVGGGAIDDCLRAIVSDMPQGKITPRIGRERVGPEAQSDPLGAGNFHQGEQGIAPRIGEGGSHPMRAAVSLTGHTGQSDETHSPDEWARTVVRRMSPASSMAVVCTVAISCLPSALRTISSPLESEA